MSQPNPHDALFKRIFGDPRVSADVLRRLLGPEVADRFDWQTLRRVPTEFIGADLTDRRADLVFEVEVAGHPAFVFILLEHQSAPDARMPFRALVYMVRIWERWLRDHAAAQRLPAIVPVVVYHGERPWTAPRALAEMFELPDALRAALAPYLPDVRLLLDDLERTTDEQIEASTRVALATAGLLMLRNRNRFEQPAHLDRLVEHLVAAAQDTAVIPALQEALCYVYRVSDLEIGTLERRIAPRVPPAVEEAVMTTAERLEARGEARGLARGEARGLARGEARGSARIVLRQITLKFGPPDDLTRARIESADSDTLDRWAERILSAETLDDVLR